MIFVEMHIFISFWLIILNIYFILTRYKAIILSSRIMYIHLPLTYLCWASKCNCCSSREDYLVYTICKKKRSWVLYLAIFYPNKPQSNLQSPSIPFPTTGSLWARWDWEHSERTVTEPRSPSWLHVDN